jgi:hypothetical protein
MMTTGQTRRTLLGMAAWLLPGWSCGGAQRRMSMEFSYVAVQGAGDVSIDLSIRNGIATMIRCPEMPQEGGVIGVFRAPADAAFVAWLEKNVPAQVTASSDQGLQPGGSHLEVKMTTASRNVLHSVGVPSAGSQALAAVTAEVQKQAAVLQKSPFRAIAVESVGPAANGKAWRLRLVNPGTHPVPVNWKRGPLRVEAFDGKDVSLISTQGAAITGVLPAVLEGGAKVDLEIPVEFPRAGSWQVRGVYQVYAGTKAEAGPVGGSVASRYAAATIR